MNFQNEPFDVIVDKNGYFSKEYMDWAICAKNYPGSSLMREDFCGMVDGKDFNGVTYVSTEIPFKLHDEALECVLKIRNFGGLAFIKPCRRQNQKMYMVWFNPNGSKDARDYVMGW